ncbi:MAG: hypothetical protein ACYTHJ_21630 [Planctomycetota bacterium]|jgi:hypothetical protein
MMRKAALAILLALTGWLTFQAFCDLDGAESYGAYRLLGRTFLLVPQPWPWGLSDSGTETLATTTWPVPIWLPITVFGIYPASCLLRRLARSLDLKARKAPNESSRVSPSWQVGARARRGFLIMLAGTNLVLGILWLESHIRTSSHGNDQVRGRNERVESQDGNPALELAAVRGTLKITYFDKRIVALSNLMEPNFELGPIAMVADTRNCHGNLGRISFTTPFWLAWAVTALPLLAVASRRLPSRRKFNTCACSHDLTHNETNACPACGMATGA